MIGGIASAIGSVAGSIISADQARKATDKQIRWEKERATNAHQWEVQDLINAGLNPILSAGGSGAVTGGISAPVPDTTGISEGIEKGINTAIALKQMKKDLKLKDEQIKQAKTQSALNSASTTLAFKNADAVNSQIRNTDANTARTVAETAINAQNIRRATAEADTAEARRDADMPLLQAEREYNNTEQAQTMHNLNTGPGVVKNLAYYLIPHATSAQGIARFNKMSESTAKRLTKAWKPKGNRNNQIYGWGAH